MLLIGAGCTEFAAARGSHPQSREYLRHACHAGGALIALTKREVFADQTLWSVANLLGVRHLGLSYSQAITEWDDIDDGFQPGWEQFRHLK